MKYFVFHKIWISALFFCKPVGKKWIKFKMKHFRWYMELESHIFTRALLLLKIKALHGTHQIYSTGAPERKCLCRKLHQKISWWNSYPNWVSSKICNLPCLKCLPLHVCSCRFLSSPVKGVEVVFIMHSSAYPSKFVQLWVHVSYPGQ